MKWTLESTSGGVVLSTMETDLTWSFSVEHTITIPTGGVVVLSTKNLTCGGDVLSTRNLTHTVPVCSCIIYKNDLNRKA